MCGHVGMAGELTLDAEKAFRTLLILDTLRGEHSTGVLGVGRFTNSPSIVKQVGNPFELFNDQRYDQKIEKVLNKVLLGHNRYATQGKVNKANAHPYEFGTIIGAHNGTISNKHALNKGSTFDVDSQAIINSIDEEGIEATIPKLRGAWALVWWDMIDDTINFIRNSERTLYMCWSQDKKMMFWASEMWMLEVALTRHNIKFEKPAALAEDSWLSIPVKDKGELGKGVVKKILSPKWQYPVINRPGNTASSSQNSSTSSKSSNVITLPNRQSHKTMPSGVLGGKDVVLELGFRGTTNDGARYFSCEDPIRKDLDIRLFPRKDDKWQLGDLVTGNIHAWEPKDGYFKVAPDSVKLVELSEVSEQSESSQDTFFDHKGREITRKEFEERYSYCSWCSSSINPDDDGNHLSPHGDCLCPICAADEDVKQYCL